MMTRAVESPLQKFDGEDLNGKARKKYQDEQNRKWFTEQMKERDQAKNNQALADKLYENKMKELDDRAMDLQKAEEDCRRAINMATKDFNKAQDQERKEKERLRDQQNLDDNMTEIANHVYGDILTENPAIAQSAFGPHRVITDRWKGMTPQQLEDIRKEQERQRLENERRKMEDELRNKEWERQQNANARAGLLMEREADRKRRDIQKQQADENRRLGQEQNAHQDFMDKEVYTNPPTAAYFMQFNTTTR